MNEAQKVCEQIEEKVDEFNDDVIIFNPKHVGIGVNPRQILIVMNDGSVLEVWAEDKEDYVYMGKGTFKVQILINVGWQSVSENELMKNQKCLFEIKDKKYFITAATKYYDWDDSLEIFDKTVAMGYKARIINILTNEVV